jgi:hypothetical protein
MFRRATQQESSIRVAALEFRRQLGLWVGFLAETFSMAKNGELSPAERQVKLRDVGLIEANLDAAMRTLEEIVNADLAFDSEADVDLIRDWLVRTRVALRMPDRDLSASSQRTLPEDHRIRR